MNKATLYKAFLIVLTTIFCSQFSIAQTIQTPPTNDTLVVGAVIINGDTLEAKTLDDVVVNGKLTPEQLAALAKWTRLRNAVYVTYPYAKRAGALMNDMNAVLVNIPNKEKRREYIKSREKELKKEFTTPLTNLSVYQGKVLMKLINRETGNNCYEIIKEFKGGFMARFYQTVAFFFNSNLKQPYDPTGEDAEMEKIVLDVRKMYGYPNG
ncbi:MAG: DUF4294 domain-containing protein [Ferruginibacter sp.]|nr:DUF4294 domain-containing protein [Ferruginibacter sp.]